MARRSPSARPAGSSEERPKYALRVNTFDRASSILIALLILVGATVVGLVIVFFSNSVITVATAIPVTPVEATGQAAKGIADDASPGLENAPDELEPQLQDTLNLMAGLVAAQTALYDNDSLENQSNPSKGEGLGDSRGVGDGTGTAPREPQREIRFEPQSIEEYARWFDQWGFEIGVLGADDRVYYASNVSAASPNLRDGAPEEETRLYFNSMGGPLESLDRQLARKAGIAGRGRLVIQFCSPQTAGLLLGLEKQAADGRPAEEISRTVFRVRKKGDAYEFSVEDQQFRF